MPVTDEERRSRLVAAARHAEGAPWELQASDVMRHPRRRLSAIGTGPGRPTRRPTITRVAAVVFALLIVTVGGIAALTRGRSSSAPAGGPVLQVVFRPASTAPAAALERDALVMRERAADLGVAGATVTVGQGDIVLDLPVGTSNATVAEISSDAQLLFRPVLCGAPSFRASGTATSGGAIPLTCPAANLYTAADYQAPEFNPPAAWGRLRAVPSTPASADDPHHAVLLLDPAAEYAPRLLLGPEVATGDIVASAHAETVITGEWVVDLNLTPSGIRLFDAAAVRSYDTPMAVDLGGSLEEAPVILAKSFPTGVIIQRAGDGLTEQQAKDLAAELGHGSLDLPLREVSAQVVAHA